VKDLWRTVKYASHFKFDTVLTFVLSSASSLIDLLPPIVYKLFFDLAESTIKTGVTSVTYQKFTQYSLIYLALAVFEILVNRTNMYQWVKWMNKTEAFLNKEAFSHVQNLSLEFFTTNQTGKIVERISKGIGDVLTIMQGVVFQFFPQFVVFLVATAVLFRVNWTFGLIVGVGIPVYVSITLAFNKSLIKIHDDIRKDYESMGAIRTESIYNIRTIKSYVQESTQLNKFLKHMNNKVEHNMNWARTANIMYVLRGIIYYGSFFAALSLGILMVIKGNITMGTFILIWSYLGRVYDPMQWIMRLYDDTLRSLRSVKRLYDTLDTKPTVVDKPYAKPLKITEASIEIKPALPTDQRTGTPTALSALG
jgi:ABC-type multidrug transport system fused ATPase/permease subunit